MKDSDTRRAVDWGHFALLVAICAVVGAYLYDARATSLKLNNLLLLEPAAILALVLAAIVLPQCFRRAHADPQPSTESWRELGKVAAMTAAFGAFALSLETVGFDVATFLFVALGVYICGERRLWVIAVFSAVFTAVVVYGYQTLVPYPFPLTVL